MSERLTIVGVKSGITEKSNGWFEIAVSVPGSDYPKKMSTKKQELVEMARAAGMAEMAWTYSESDSGTPNPHRPGTNYVNRYFEGVAPVEEGEEMPVSGAQTPSAATKASDGGMSKAEWAQKDSAIHHMAAIKAAADALKHTIPSEPDRDALNNFISNTLHVARAWHRIVLATRDDPMDEEVPFE